ncbi:Rieske (2Fe-2S) protein [Streptomyces sp. RB6PN25]|uniref:Cytochrome bc1 complex Rieske iron-sulfur subunit n=1 Tax=Streptomyces humicola TaxID=2953240 RepID=A0ABT1PUT1_9ACTN|nr:Rieske (2Fe-2S) protein [Streptomyces humicola]MCQ4081436.1 Rieske (2Fe-2S) protein [Streptomyces humicola]
MTDQPTARRTVLQGAALAGAAGLGLTACSAGGGGTSASSGPTGRSDLGSTAQVPLGGAKLFRDDQVVVAQPTKGTFKAFSAVCTHAGCIVDQVQNGVISCPCHGSQFNATTGAVIHGPATEPLNPVGLQVQGDKLIANP